MHYITRGITIVGVSTALMGGGAYGSYELSKEQTGTLAEYNGKIEDCAKSLGKNAVIADHLPKRCVGVSDLDTTPVFSPISAEDLRYYLPPKDQFLEDHIETADSLEAKHRETAVLGLAAGTVLGLLASVSLTGQMGRDIRRTVKELL
jgi:hypothetical protein